MSLNFVEVKTMYIQCLQTMKKCWRNYVTHNCVRKDDDYMTSVFFDAFPTLWDAFVKQLEGPIVKALEAKLSGGVDSGETELSSIYWKIGFAFWCSSKGMGASWNTQLEEVFFEYRCYDTVKQLNHYSNLDALVAQGMENLSTLDARQIYRLAVLPLLDERKKKLMAAFVEMGKELDDSLPYTLHLPVDGQEAKMLLGFRNRHKKRSSDGMDGYTYSFNGRTYQDVRPFTTETIEKLSENVSIARDAFGEMVLRRYTNIPTFDSGDREWDSAEIEYLMFDGKDIHLIIMRGGYRIAYLIFYEKLLTADARMKPIFKKLSWPVDNITWT